MQPEPVRIRLNEIFVGIEGEVNYWGVGGFTIFIRVQGCSATCSFCDTPTARPREIIQETFFKTAQEIAIRTRKLKLGKITITGGEPMEQPEGLEELLHELTGWGFNISVETNGYHRITNLKKLYPDVSFVMDCKFERLPPYQNFIGLKDNDFVKFVIASKEELPIVINKARFILNVGSPQLAISPIKSDSFNEADVVDYLIKNKLFYFRLNFQAHKLMGLK